MAIECLPGFPHCDSEILHAPKSCYFCDHFPTLQQERINKGINFSNRDNQDPEKEKCPSEKKRPLWLTEKWYGNRPYKSLSDMVEARRNFYGKDL